MGLPSKSHGGAARLDEPLIDDAPPQQQYSGRWKSVLVTIGCWVLPLVVIASVVVLISAAWLAAKQIAQQDVAPPCRKSTALAVFTWEQAITGKAAGVGNSMCRQPILSLWSGKGKRDLMYDDYYEFSFDKGSWTKPQRTGGNSGGQRHGGGADEPKPRWKAAVAESNTRGAMVVMGGDPNGDYPEPSPFFLADTWALRLPQTPTTRFTGCNGGSNKNGSGTNGGGSISNGSAICGDRGQCPWVWTQLGHSSDASGGEVVPSPRRAHSAVTYVEPSTGREVLLVYGGKASPRGYLNDVWCLDISPPGGPGHNSSSFPPPRWLQLWPPVGEAVVEVVATRAAEAQEQVAGGAAGAGKQVMGGAAGSGARNDGNDDGGNDGITLSKRVRPHVPSARKGHVAVLWWAPDGHPLMVVHGGRKGDNYLADTWAFNLTSLEWQEMVPPAPPAGPGSAAVQRQEQQGGSRTQGGATAAGEAAGTGAEPLLPVAEAVRYPVKRDHHAAVLHQDSLIVFGGRSGNSHNGSIPLGDLWVLDLRSRQWKQVHVRAAEEGDQQQHPWPWPRFLHSMATYTQMESGHTRSKALVFGGEGEGNCYLNDLWELDLEAEHGMKAWRLLHPAKLCQKRCRWRLKQRERIGRQGIVMG